MKYIIPQYKMAELQKEINRIRNKGANINFEIKERNIFYPYDFVKGIVCDKVEVSGEYRINGWTFVAIIEHASPENIIRIADPAFYGRIPERYRTAGRDCEHCHITRDRNDTYLVYNEDNDEFKQVGKTCLKSYTNGLNAEVCAALACVQTEIQRLSKAVEEETFPDEFLSNLQDEPLLMKDVKGQAYSYVEQNGYVPQRSKSAFLELLHDNNLPDPVSTEKIEEVTNWLNNIEDSDFIRNAKVVWNKDVFEERDCAYVLALINSFLKWKQNEIKKQNRLDNIDTSIQDNVGDKREVEIVDARVLYYKSASYGYRNNVSYPVYKIIGTDNKIYIWSCSSGIELEKGMRIVGTVKKVSEYKGEPQIELTRCKVL